VNGAFIAQGWVPPTCTLTEAQALALWPAVHAGTDPCLGCCHDRATCGGRHTAPDPATMARLRPAPSLAQLHAQPDPPTLDSVGKGQRPVASSGRRLNRRTWQWEDV
jgi:hypothetical protein